MGWSEASETSPQTVRAGLTAPLSWLFLLRRSGIAGVTRVLASL